MTKYGEVLTLALTIYGEARGEPLLGQIAVGCVVRNRVFNSRWPNTFEEVCRQRLQFSCWNPDDPNYPKLQELGDGLLAGKIPSIAFEQYKWIATGIIGNDCPDVTMGANHYHTTAIKPKWADHTKVTVTIGNHVFSRL